MMNLLHLLSMDGYGKYVFSAYAVVLILLGVQLYIPWQRWRRFTRKKRDS